MLMGYLRCKKDSPASSGGGDTGGGSLTGTGGGSLTGTNGGGTVFCSSCASTHTINVSPGGYCISLQMDQNEYNSWINNYYGTGGYHDNSKREALINDIYAKFNHQDPFDFIFLMINNTSTNPPNNSWPYGELLRVSNNVSGIGLSIDNSQCALYGSAGKLKSVMSLCNTRALTYGPSLHEIMHTWGNFIIPTQDLDASGNTIPGMPHWGISGADVNPRLGGAKESAIVDLGSGVYQLIGGPRGNDGGYSQMELYLMGMIPLSSVQPFSVFSNVRNPSHVTNGVQFSGTRKIYQQADIVSAAAAVASGSGTRVPSSDTSQKSFRLLLVILTPTPLTADQWTAFDQASENFGRYPAHNDNYPGVYNFYEATGGRATMQTGNLK